MLVVFTFILEVCNIEVCNIEIFRSAFMLTHLPTLYCRLVFIYDFGVKLTNFVLSCVCGKYSYDANIPKYDEVKTGCNIKQTII